MKIEDVVMGVWYKIDGYDGLERARPIEIVPQDTDIKGRRYKYPVLKCDYTPDIEGHRAYIEHFRPDDLIEWES